MAAAAPIIAAVTAPTLTGAALRIGLSLAVSFVTNKLFAPDIPESNGDLSQAPDQGVVQRIATNTSNKLPVVYGESRVFGSITFADITSNNQTMAFIISLCEGPIQSVDKIYWDSYELSFEDTDGNATTDLAGGLRNVSNARDGNGETNDFLNGNLRIRAYPEGNRCDEMQMFSSRWNTNSEHRTMPNIAYLYVELDYNREKQVTGLTSKLGASIKGKRVRDITKTGSAPAEFGEVITATTNTNWNNPALCLADYLTNNTYGCGNVISDSDLDLETFYSHKIFCNNTANGDGNTTKRYTTNGVANTNDTRDIIISDLTSNSQSIFAYQLGKYQMISDTTGTSVMDFDDSNTYGDVTIVNDGINSLKNSMSASYISKNNRDKESQVFVEVAEGDAIRGFNENELVQDTRFKFINNKIEAERALTVLLNKSRDTLIVSFNTDTKAFRLQVNDVIRYSNSTYNFTNKLFKINSISETQLENDLSGYTITAQEYDQDHYDYDVITAEELAPNTNLPNPNNIGKPTNVRVATNSPNDSEQNNGQISLLFNTPTDIANVNSFQIFYSTSNADNASRIHIDTVELLEGEYAANTPVRALVNNVPNGTIYFSVRAVSSLGNVGPYSSFSNHVEYTRTASPYTEYLTTIADDVTPLSEEAFLAGALVTEGSSTYQIYAYTKGNTAGTPITYSRPTLPPTGGNIGVTRILTTNPSSAGTDNAVYVASLEDTSLDLFNDTIYRSQATVTVTGTTHNIGTWSRPTQFLFPVRDGTVRRANRVLTRYGVFSSDNEAQTARNSITNANGLSNDWLSNPDLLGTDAQGNPIQYTHTITQFGGVQAGRPTTRNYTLSGTVPTTGAGSPYIRNITYTGPTPTTQYTGQQLSSFVVNLNTGVNSSTARNNTDGPNAGWTTNDSLGSDGFLVNFEGITLDGSIGTTSSRRLSVRINGNRTYVSTSSFDTATTFASFTTMINRFAIGLSGTSMRFTNAASGASDSIIFRHTADGVLNPVFIEYFDNGTDTIDQIETIRFGFANTAGTGQVFNATNTITLNAASQNIRKYYYNTDRYGSLIPTITKNGEMLNYTFTNPNWNSTETWATYLGRLESAIESIGSDISSVDLINSNTDLRITFNNSDSSVNYGVSVANAASNPGPFGSPSTTSVSPTVIGSTPNKSTFRLHNLILVPETGPLPPETDEDERVSFSQIDSTTKWYYSDSYLSTPIEGNYTGDETDLDDLLRTIANQLSQRAHMTAQLAGTGDNELLITYDATSTYTNPQTGLSSGPDGRNPNAFINFGITNNNRNIIKGFSRTTIVGNGAGNLVTAIPTGTLRTYNGGPWNGKVLHIDNNHVSIYRQLENAANVLYPNIFNTQIIDNTVRFTTKQNNVDPGVILGFGAGVWGDDEFSINGNNFSNNFTDGSLGIVRNLIIRRTKSPDPTQLYDIKTFPNENINLYNIEGTGDTFIENLIIEIARLGPKNGIYVNNLAEAGKFQIQDAGTSGDDITVELSNAGSSFNLVEDDILIGKRASLTTAAELENHFTVDDWSRPSNTGRQV